MIAENKIWLYIKWLSIFFIAWPVMIMAQNTSAEKSLKQVQKKINAKKYVDAIELLNNIIQADSNNANAYYTLAEVQLQIRDYIAAKENFYKATQKTNGNLPFANYYYALMLKMNGEYAKAKTTFQQLLKSYNTKDNFYEWASVEIAGCDTALSKRASNYEEGLTIKYLPGNINSRYSEMGPMFWDEATLLYASLPKDTMILVTGDSVLDYHIKFFLADVVNDSFFNPQRINDFTVPNASLASGTLSADKTKFFFTVCLDQSYNSNTICQIYVSKFQNGAWNEPEPLSSPLNDIRYSNKHPSVVPFKKGKMLLYFSSDRPGGKGGSDIWYSIIDADNKSSAPQNAGSINTTRDDITPFYDYANGYLYFSSNGHIGFGGLDVYRVTGERNIWKQIENMKMPINSSVDDLYFSFDAQRNKGLLVSNRSEKNISGSTCCDDIFYVKYQKPKKLAIIGNVYDADENNTEPLQDIRAALFETDSAGNSVLLQEKVTQGTMPFYFILKPEKNYSLQIIKEGYFNKTAAFTTIGKVAPDSIFAKVLLEKIQPEKTYRLSSIYYNYNDFALLPEAKQTLDTLYDILQENENLKIELSSHTDSRGKEIYNLQLSQKRAQSCVSYLISKGITANRLTAKGYGASQPIKDCSTTPECTDTQDCDCFQLNRRTEFKVIKGEE